MKKKRVLIGAGAVLALALAVAAAAGIGIKYWVDSRSIEGGYPPM